MRAVIHNGYMSTIRNSIAALEGEITGYRRALHENPGTAYEEFFASDLVAEKLTEWGITFERGIAQTGIVATIKGQTNKSGRAIALRADMDALDIVEAENKDHRSKIEGKMHGCGHDGHTACLLGAAKYLSENNAFDGTVHLIFQPAEEGHGGAYKMLDEGLLSKFPFDAVFALHNWPSLPKGTIALRSGPIMAAADRFDIVIKGAGGHAAYPERCLDPIIIGSHIVQALQTLISRSIDPQQPAVISITNFHAGTGAFNVIPDEAHLNGTLRSFDPKIRQKLTERITQICEDTAKLYGATAECVFDEGGYDPTINSEEESAFCAEIARSIVGADNVNESINPSMGAEDFGAMLAQRPGCYIWMGQGEADPQSNHNQGLHTPRYDFNDSIIPQAIEYWARVVERYLPLER